MDYETVLRNEIEADMDNTIGDCFLNKDMKGRNAARKAKDKWIKAGRPVNERTLEAFKKGLENGN